MNMFKKNKKAKDHDDGSSSFAADNSHMSKASRALTRRKKKQDVEEKPVFDLSAALPDTNDFRTSLLMPNLSARFSMLREQDDPTTKVGKASDDSVLFPKRASRMNLFSNNPLTDIAEVESIRSGFRPPFADERQSAFSDGYASDDGASMIHRSRQGEGNNLFGGRQKLYKVNATVTKDAPNTNISAKKHVYENDVSLSAFQQYRRKERGGREHQRDADEGTDRSSYPVTDHEEHDSSRSPLTNFSQNRGTQSSTNSGPSNRRTSTAATSVVSESPLPQNNNHVINKVKEIDANSSAESIGFAASPGLRTFSAEEGRLPIRLSGSRSAANMRDHYSRQSPVPAFRTLSPPLNAIAQLDFGLKESKSTATSQRHQTTSPPPHFDFEQGEALASSVRPKDHGKATAMGLFNKPARHYDDLQFQQRQVQMHEGRNSPVSVTSHAESRASPEPVRSNRPSYASSTYAMSQDERHTPQLPPIPAYPPSPVSNRRSSATSTGRDSTSRARAKSSASVREAAVKARVESLIRRQNAELTALEVVQMGPTSSISPNGEPTKPDSRTQNGTFFDTSDYSDDEQEEEDLTSKIARIDSRPKMPPPPPPTDVHPALRNDRHSSEVGDEERKPSYTRHSNFSTRSKRPISDRNQRSEHDTMPGGDDRDSLSAPNTGLGLSGLIRTHLRHDSDRSSILPPPSPAFPGTDGSRGSVSSTSRTVTESVKSDPFEYDNQRLNIPPVQNIQSPTTTLLMSQSAHQILQNAKAIRDAQIREDAPSNTDTSRTPQLAHTTQPTMVNEGYAHQRNESTETQREQKRFDQELVECRKRVEEGLKSVQERSRSRSPIAERNGGNHGFSLPRFPGRSNTGDRVEPPVHNKAMKMLGISNPRDQQGSPIIPQDSYMAEYDHQRSTRSRHGERQQISHNQEPYNGKFTPMSGRSVPRAGDRPPAPRSTTPSDRSATRERSNSGAASRSVSRNKQIPEFDPVTMPGTFPHSPFMASSPGRELGQRSQSPSVYERSGSNAAGNNGDRLGYFASKPMTPHDLSNGFTPRPSPRPSPNPVDAAFHPEMVTPLSPPSSAMPSPNPAMNGRTTPSSNHGRTTPSSLPGRATPSGTRKRSVTKHMISEPTFVSSTSTVPLVHLPRDGGPAVEAILPPPLPTMNPRRREIAGDEPKPVIFNAPPTVRPAGALSPVHAPSRPFEYSNPDPQPFQSPPSRQRNRLRKTSSEGGNMASRARQQALAAEMALEKDRSPKVAVFPNRSAISLATHEGGMF